MSDVAMTALDHHLDLLRFYSTDPGMMLIGSLGRQAGVQESGMPLAKVVALGLNQADTYGVTAEIGAVIAEGAKTIPEYALHLEDVPSATGLVYLEEPVAIPDDNGLTLVVRSFFWMTSALHMVDGKYRVSFSERAIEAAFRDPTYSQADARWGLTLFLFTNPGDPRDHLYEKQKEFLADPRPEARTAAYSIARAPGMALFAGVWVEGEPATKVSQRYWAAFFRFIGEPFVDDRPERAPRAAARRSERAGWSRPPEVRVIRLRRAYGGLSSNGGGNGHGSIHVRFPVRGHWRNQWYPSRQDHAPKWIPAYMKGPEAAPLVGTDRIFRVDR